jgi:hypothetical protein
MDTMAKYSGQSFRIPFYLYCPRQRSEVALTALHTTGKGILAKMLTFVFDKSEFEWTQIEKIIYFTRRLQRP